MRPFNDQDTPKVKVAVRADSSSLLPVVLVVVGLLSVLLISGTASGY